jgi:hypothetical protein
VQRQTRLCALVAGMQTLEGLEYVRHEGVHPFGQGAPGVEQRSDGTIKVAADEVVFAGHVEREGFQGQGLAEIRRVWRKELAGRQRAGWVGRGECVDARGGHGVGVGIEFAYGRYLQYTLGGSLKR